MLEILIASNNKNKIKEYNEIFEGLDIKFYSLKDLNIDIDPEENGKSYFENALIKAKAAAEFTKMPIISDDSGIEIKALKNHLPGIYSHRYMEENGGQIETNKMLVSKYAGSKATFICTIVLYNFKKKPLKFVGKVKGLISDKIYAADFGYDPIFKVKKINKIYGEMSEEEKNKNSHRYFASMKLLKYLKNRIWESYFFDCFLSIKYITRQATTGINSKIINTVCFVIK